MCRPFPRHHDRDDCQRGNSIARFTADKNSNRAANEPGRDQDARGPTGPDELTRTIMVQREWTSSSCPTRLALFVPSTRLH
jgi:hypothetical protein